MLIWMHVLIANVELKEEDINRNQIFDFYFDYVFNIFDWKLHWLFYSFFVTICLTSDRERLECKMLK